MAARVARPYSEPLKLLWSAGTCAGMSDGRLLAQFLAGRDEAGELAFEVLVKRHGPMVLRVCHQVLDDPADIHDAWQAVFLVLARRTARSATANLSPPGFMVWRSGLRIGRE